MLTGSGFPNRAVKVFFCNLALTEFLGTNVQDHLMQCNCVSLDQTSGRTPLKKKGKEK